MKCPKCDFENPADTIYCGKCATPLPSAEEAPAPHTKTLETPIEELTTGTTFAGRYQIIEELGKGGMGKVYRALDKELNEEVALKLIKPEIASDKKVLKRFTNELKLARKIIHRNVGRMYELMEDKGTYFITMEYVPGEDLKSFIRRAGPLGAGKAISIAKQVCDGLGEAHRLGVVHRDLKPSNIMIDKEGNARIMDFGIARSLKAKGITGAGIMIGTPEYMSPEQVEAKETDQRSDIYSLGIILYEMTTGRLPFEADTPFAVGVKHKSEIPKDPKGLYSQIPEDLSRLILKCLEKEKEARYQSAGELRSELENIEKGIPTTERVSPKRKPITSKEITVTFSLKRLLVPALAVAALVIIVLMIWRPWSPKEEVPIPSDKPSLAIVYFENNTGDESLDNWRSGIPELLITDLFQSKYLYVLPGDRIYSILRRLALLDAKKYSSEDLVKVADQGGVTYVLKGSFIKAGDNFHITVMLQKPGTGETVSSRKVECRGEVEIPAKVDELTKKIKSDLNLTREQITSDLDKEVGKITTSSPEAFKFFSEAVKCQIRGDYAESIPLYEKSIAIDPEFAMAYRGMASAYSNVGRGFERRKYLQKAFQLSDRVSDRERYQIQAAFYSRSEKTYDKSIETLSKLLELYPDDLIGNNNLALKYRNLEEWDKAIEGFEVLIKIKDKSVFPYGNQAVAYRAKGLYDKAREVIEIGRRNFQDTASFHRTLAMTYICQGEYDLARVEMDKAFSLDPINWRNSFGWGDISLYEHNWDQAEKEYKELFESKQLKAHDIGRRRLGNLFLLQGRFEDSKNQFKQGIELAEKTGELSWRSWHHHYLSYLYLKSGNFDKALEECNRTLDAALESDNLSWQRQSLHAKGIIHLENKSINEAKRVADELKELIKGGLHKKAIRYYFHLMGMIELKKKNFSSAIELFKKAISLLPFQYTDGQYTDDDTHALFIDPLAFAYYRSGDLDKAKDEYDKITELTTGRILFGDIYAKSYYMLGKIYEKKGDKSQAIEHYEKFLDLWKDADPGTPEVDDAKKKLLALKGN